MKPEMQAIFDFYAGHVVDIEDFVKDINHLGPFDSLLHMAVRMSKLEHIQILVEAGADINAKDDMGFTPLHEAAFCGNAKAAELLLMLGARGDIKNQFNDTPLDTAAKAEADRPKRRKRARVSDLILNARQR
jgi:ankyrin repeat protein